MPSDDKRGPPSDDDIEALLERIERSHVSLKRIPDESLRQSVPELRPLELRNVNQAAPIITPRGSVQFTQYTSTDTNPPPSGRMGPGTNSFVSKVEAIREGIKDQLLAFEQILISHGKTSQSQLQEIHNTYELCPCSPLD
jgi:hypothetical protein